MGGGGGLSDFGVSPNQIDLHLIWFGAWQKVHGEASGPSGENFESRWSVNGNIGYFTPLFENDKNWNIW